MIRKNIFVLGILMMVLSACTGKKNQGGECCSQEPAKHNNSELEPAVTEVIKECLTENDWNNATVYVVETMTGKIKANVSLMRKDTGVEPYTDTYNQERSQMLGAPAYLALLVTEKVTPESVFDTEGGIYGQIKDHNWRKGGYGELNMERALGVRSQVAFAKAWEQAYGTDSTAFVEKVKCYLGDEPDRAVGILTFYNAVANGGRMLKLVTEGEDGIVLCEQFAPRKHIETLQRGLERSVSEGIFKTAGRDNVKVAACGRTFVKEGDTRRMELCGYFPADNPKFTIMVIIEKEGLPAAANHMCGPVMARIIDILSQSGQTQAGIKSGISNIKT